jgi:uncharacterized phage-associated protein
MTDTQYIFLNTIAYVTNKYDNRSIGLHKLCKILYFAEQKHLVKFGSKLMDDNFVAMENGPVPSAMYDMLKALRSKAEQLPIELRESLVVDRHLVISLSEPDMDWLSESEIECIDQSFNENNHLTFGQLSDKSHDSAWHAGFYMETKNIAIAAGANEDMIAYITNQPEKITY